MTMIQDAAVTLALEALGWLAGHDDLLGVFMGSTGATQNDIKDGANDPVFLGSVLDFLMMNDEWVIEFCTAYGHANEAPMHARAVLPGGEEMNWT